ncbi:tripartite motif-containing protein 59-like [Lytechinus variegatus]|uniref:tripartite motif-containing protein 59-like n=1 Tax=Lytechinus variegatus TaxID=7654 RepID=UPI001BB1FC2D|nr:tripartite motif-containing protein 59-like [Lytechinus variegatus]
MAEKAVEQNLSCPLCFEIFDEPTILTSCGHTFCRKCLKNYDKSQSRKEPDRNYMVCPICRGITEFKSTNRVDDFCPNLLVKCLVDDVKDVLEKKNLKSNTEVRAAAAVVGAATKDSMLDEGQLLGA